MDPRKRTSSLSDPRSSSNTQHPTPLYQRHRRQTVGGGHKTSAPLVNAAQPFVKNRKLLSRRVTLPEMPLDYSQDHFLQFSNGGENEPEKTGGVGEYSQNIHPPQQPSSTYSLQTSYKVCSKSSMEIYFDLYCTMTTTSSMFPPSPSASSLPLSIYYCLIAGTEEGDQEDEAEGRGTEKKIKRKEMASSSSIALWQTLSTDSTSLVRFASERTFTPHGDVISSTCYLQPVEKKSFKKLEKDRKEAKVTVTPSGVVMVTSTFLSHRAVATISGVNLHPQYRVASTVLQHPQISTQKNENIVFSPRWSCFHRHPCDEENNNRMLIGGATPPSSSPMPRNRRRSTIMELTATPLCDDRTESSPQRTSAGGGGGDVQLEFWTLDLDRVVSFNKTQTSAMKMEMRLNEQLQQLYFQEGIDVEEEEDQVGEEIAFALDIQAPAEHQPAALHAFPSAFETAQPTCFTPRYDDEEGEGAVEQQKQENVNTKSKKQAEGEEQKVIYSFPKIDQQRRRAEKEEEERIQAEEDPLYGIDKEDDDDDDDDDDDEDEKSSCSGGSSHSTQPQKEEVIVIPSETPQEEREESQQPVEGGENPQKTIFDKNYSPILQGHAYKSVLTSEEHVTQLAQHFHKYLIGVTAHKICPIRASKLTIPFRIEEGMYSLQCSNFVMFLSDCHRIVEMYRDIERNKSLKSSCHRVVVANTNNNSQNRPPINHPSGFLAAPGALGDQNTTSSAASSCSNISRSAPFGRKQPPFSESAAMTSFDALSPQEVIDALIELCSEVPSSSASTGQKKSGGKSSSACKGPWKIEWYDFLLLATVERKYWPTLFHIARQYKNIANQMKIDAKVYHAGGGAEHQYTTRSGGLHHRAAAKSFQSVSQQQHGYHSFPGPRTNKQAEEVQKLLCATASQVIFSQISSHHLHKKISASGSAKRSTSLTTNLANAQNLAMEAEMIAEHLKEFFALPHSSLSFQHENEERLGDKNNRSPKNKLEREVDENDDENKKRNCKNPHDDDDDDYKKYWLEICGANVDSPVNNGIQLSPSRVIWCMMPLEQQRLALLCVNQHLPLLFTKKKANRNRKQFDLAIRLLDQTNYILSLKFFSYWNTFTKSEIQHRRRQGLTAGAFERRFTTVILQRYFSTWERYLIQVIIFRRQKACFDKILCGTTDYLMRKYYQMLRRFPLVNRSEIVTRHTTQRVLKIFLGKWFRFLSCQKSYQNAMLLGGSTNRSLRQVRWNTWRRFVYYQNLQRKRVVALELFKSNETLHLSIQFHQWQRRIMPVVKKQRRAKLYFRNREQISERSQTQLLLSRLQTWIRFHWKLDRFERILRQLKSIRKYSQQCLSNYSFQKWKKWFPLADEFRTRYQLRLQQSSNLAAKNNNIFLKRYFSWKWNSFYCAQFTLRARQSAAWAMASGLHSSLQRAFFRQWRIYTRRKTSHAPRKQAVIVFLATNSQLLQMRFFQTWLKISPQRQKILEARRMKYECVHQLLVKNGYIYFLKSFWKSWGFFTKEHKKQRQKMAFVKTLQISNQLCYLQRVYRIWFRFHQHLKMLSRKKLKVSVRKRTLPPSQVVEDFEKLIADAFCLQYFQYWLSFPEFVRQTTLMKIQEAMDGCQSDEIHARDEIENKQLFAGMKELTRKGEDSYQDANVLLDRRLAKESEERRKEENEELLDRENICSERQEALLGALHYEEMEDLIACQRNEAQRLQQEFDARGEVESNEIDARQVNVEDGEILAWQKFWEFFNLDLQIVFSKEQKHIFKQEEISREEEVIQQEKVSLKGLQSTLGTSFQDAIEKLNQRIQLEIEIVVAEESKQRMDNFESQMEIALKRFEMEMKWSECQADERSEEITQRSDIIEQFNTELDILIEIAKQAVAMLEWEENKQRTKICHVEEIKSREEIFQIEKLEKLQQTDREIIMDEEEMLLSHTFAVPFQRVGRSIEQSEFQQARHEIEEVETKTRFENIMDVEISEKKNQILEAEKSEAQRILEELQKRERIHFEEKENEMRLQNVELLEENDWEELQKSQVENYRTSLQCQTIREISEEIKNTENAEALKRMQNILNVEKEHIEGLAALQEQEGKAVIENQMEEKSRVKILKEEENSWEVNILQEQLQEQQDILQQEANVFAILMGSGNVEQRRKFEELENKERNDVIDHDENFVWKKLTSRFAKGMIEAQQKEIDRINQEKADRISKEIADLKRKKERSEKRAELEKIRRATEKRATTRLKQAKSDQPLLFEVVGEDPQWKKLKMNRLNFIASGLAHDANIKLYSQYWKVWGQYRIDKKWERRVNTRDEKSEILATMIERVTRKGIFTHWMERAFIAMVRKMKDVKTIVMLQQGHQTATYRTYFLKWLTWWADRPEEQQKPEELPALQVGGDFSDSDSVFTADPTPTGKRKGVALQVGETVTVPGAGASPVSILKRRPSEEVHEEAEGISGRLLQEKERSNVADMSSSLKQPQSPAPGGRKNRLLSVSVVDERPSLGESGGSNRRSRSSFAEGSRSPKPDVTPPHKKISEELGQFYDNSMLSEESIAKSSLFQPVTEHHHANVRKRF